MAQYANLEQYILSQHERKIRMSIKNLLDECDYNYDCNFAKQTELRNIIVHSFDYREDDSKSYDLTIEFNVLADVVDIKNGFVIGTISLKIPMNGFLTMDESFIRLNGKKAYHENDPRYEDENNPDQLTQRMLEIIKEAKRIAEIRRQDKRELSFLINNKKDTFALALDYIISKSSNYNLTNERIAHWLGCSPKTVQNYRNGNSLPKSIDKVMLLCLALQTGPEVSRYLIEKAIGGIPDIENQRDVYELLLNYTDAHISHWNMILDRFGMKHIRDLDD